MLGCDWDVFCPAQLSTLYNHSAKGRIGLGPGLGPMLTAESTKVRTARTTVKAPETYSTEALQGGDASRKDARRAGRRVESWFELSCVE